MAERRFSTDFVYVNRETKSEYVWKKYQSVLSGGRILDVGSDECHLKNHLEGDSTYVGIGIGGNPDIPVNLETQAIPFDSESFDTVLCLDVLEHLANPHQVFAELCRVSRSHVIISLPNPYAALWETILDPTRGDKAMKYYGLPREAPVDRHKWFFSTYEAESFMRHQAETNGFSVLQIDRDGDQRKLTIWQQISQTLAKGVLSRHLDFWSLTAGTIWAILERSSVGQEPGVERTA